MDSRYDQACWHQLRNAAAQAHAEWQRAANQVDQAQYHVTRSWQDAEPSRYPRYATVEAQFRQAERVADLARQRYEHLSRQEQAEAARIAYQERVEEQRRFEDYPPPAAFDHHEAPGWDDPATSGGFRWVQGQTPAPARRRWWSWRRWR